jgi:hypothetical protein
MTQYDDLKDLLCQDYNLLDKHQILEHIGDIIQFVEQTTKLMQEEYKHGEYEHNFKQTFKHILKKYHHDHPYTKQELQIKKDLVMHYRDMLHKDVVMLGKHTTELLEHQLLDREQLQKNQIVINTLNEDIAHLSAVITSLKEYSREWF